MAARYPAGTYVAWGVFLTTSTLLGWLPMRAALRRIVRFEY
jgi:hypothetical protein